MLRAWLMDACPLQAQHRPFFLFHPSILSFLSSTIRLPLPTTLLHKRLAVLYQQEKTHEWTEPMQLKCPGLDSFVRSGLRVRSLSRSIADSSDSKVA